MNMNISFEYLYRDASNYKNWGEVVFTGRSELNIVELEQRVEQVLIDGQNFVAEDVGIPTLYFASHDAVLDHGWHEYGGISRTDKNATQMESIEQFIARLAVSKKNKSL